MITEGEITGLLGRAGAALAIKSTKPRPFRIPDSIPGNIYTEDCKLVVTCKMQNRNAIDKLNQQRSKLALLSYHNFNNCAFLFCMLQVTTNLQFSVYIYIYIYPAPMGSDLRFGMPMKFN